MQNLIYPMKMISFSQLEYGEYSHKNIPAVDMTGTGTGADLCYAPCDLEIINIGKGAENTVYFGSLEEVMCADGVKRFVTITMSHKDTLDPKEYYIGRKFKSGDECYKEGKSGLATGNHVHVEVANGIHKSKQYVTIDGAKYWRFSLEDALEPTKVFFALEGWNETRKLMGVEPKWVDERIEFPMRLKLKTVKGKQAIRASLSFKRKRTNAKLLAIIPKGNSDAIITEFVKGLQPDGYQWVKVIYHDIEGYCQWDSAWLEAVEY